MFLQPKNLINSTESEIFKSCDYVQQKYSQIISPNFSLQFINMLTLIKADLNSEMSVKNFTDLLLNKYNYLESDFAQVYIVLLLFFTMPITSASAERSFSKLKQIKNYLRNQIGQERLKY